MKKKHNTGAAWVGARAADPATDTNNNTEKRQNQEANKQSCLMEAGNEGDDTENIVGEAAGIK